MRCRPTASDCGPLDGLRLKSVGAAIGYTFRGRPGFRLTGGGISSDGDGDELGLDDADPSQAAGVTAQSGPSAVASAASFTMTMRPSRQYRAAGYIVSIATP